MRYVWASLLVLAVVLGTLEHHFPSVGQDGSAWAAELRCNELGANCVCSEPLNTNNYAIASVWANPGDSTTKECTSEVFSIPDLNGYAILTLSSSSVNALYAASPASDPTMFGALPTGHALSWVLREPGNFPFSWKVIHQQASYASRTQADAELPGNTTHAGARNGTYIAQKKFAMRYYVYFSPDFEWTGDHGGACTNGKWGGIDSLVLSNSNSGTLSHVYNFAWDLDSSGACASRGLPANCGRFKRDGISGTNFAGDCCSVGPYGSGDHPRENSAPLNAAGQQLDGHQGYRGKWWRIEAIVDNRFGGSNPNGYRMRMFGKNITDNWDEQEIFDTNGPSAAGPGGWAVSSNLVPAEVDATGLFGTEANAAIYRAGTCNGFTALSHFLIAQWDTDTGQRIGAASEIETGGPPPPGLPPNPATNVRWIVTMLVLGLSSLGVALGGYALLMRRERRDGLDFTGYDPVDVDPVLPVADSPERVDTRAEQSGEDEELVGTAGRADRREMTRRF